MEDPFDRSLKCLLNESSLLRVLANPGACDNKTPAVSISQRQSYRQFVIMFTKEHFSLERNFEHKTRLTCSRSSRTRTADQAIYLWHCNPWLAKRRLHATLANTAKHIQTHISTQLTVQTRARLEN